MKTFDEYFNHTKNFETIINVNNHIPQTNEKSDKQLQKDYEKYLKTKLKKEKKLEYDKWLKSIYFYHQN